jgi:hypothetical protein
LPELIATAQGAALALQAWLEMRPFGAHADLDIRFHNPPMLPRLCAGKQNANEPILLFGPEGMIP